MAENNGGEQKIKFFQSIRWNFILYFSLIALIPTVIVGVLGVSRSTEAILGIKEREFLKIINIQKVVIDNWLDKNLIDAKVIAETNRIRSLDPNQVSDAVEIFKRDFSDFEDIFVADLNGNTIVRPGEESIYIGDRAYFLDAITGKEAISEPLISRASGNVIVVFAQPIYSLDNPNVIVGVAVCVAPTTGFDQIFEIAYLGNTGEVYLLNKNGYFVNESRFTDELIKDGVVEERTALSLQIDSFGSQQAFDNIEGFDSYMGYRGEEIVGAYSPFERMGWALLMEQEVIEAFEESDQLRTVFIFVVIGLVTLAAVAAIFISNSLAKPILLVAEVAKRLSIGDARLVGVSREAMNKSALRKDEIGVLNRSLNDTIGYFEEMAEVSETISSNDLRSIVQPKSNEDILGHSFVKMIGNLRQIIQDIQTNSADVNHASNQLSSVAEQSGQAANQVATTVQQVASGTTEQASSANRTASAVEEVARAVDGVARGAQEQAAAIGKAAEVTSEISKSIEQVVTNVRVASEQANNASSLAQDGADVVRETVSGMTAIQNKVGASSKAVEEMGQRSQEIGAIVSTIEEIASQTNLLALNAAIEAARAGEHGKGFAVVADEVRQLAERSSRATKEIADLISGIQKTVAGAVEAMAEGQNEVSKGMAKAGEAGDALSRILTAGEQVAIEASQAMQAAELMRAASNELVSAVDAVSAVIEENTAAAEEMSASTNEVTVAIENIASVAEENSAAVEEVSASAEEMSAQAEEVAASAQSLSEMAKDLQEIISQFKI
jgi:methyl-accepting chemotaxis protein